jgi:hypothetical protein
MPDTKDPSKTVDKGSPGNTDSTEDAERDFGTGAEDPAQDSTKNAGGARHAPEADDPSVGRKPGEADAPHVPENVRPSFE